MATEYAPVRGWAILAAGALIIASAAATAACGTKASDPGTGDDTGDDDGGADAADLDAGGVFDQPATCTSNKTWQNGNQGNEEMHPGRACISCHAQNSGPTLGIAGTIYTTGHEPDDCDGVSTGLTVVITDATGKSTTLIPNAAGNFLLHTTVKTPFHAKVVKGGKERAMSASQQNGDCNFCHSQSGANGAPGRIVAP